jgi:hypothetical protein
MIIAWQWFNNGPIVTPMLNQMDDDKPGWLSKMGFEYGGGDSNLTC